MSTQPWAQALGAIASAAVRTTPAAATAGISLTMAGNLMDPAGATQ
jgi:hypothetical protein